MSWLEDLLGYKAVIDTSTGVDVEKPQRAKMRFLGCTVADNPSLGTTDVTPGLATIGFDAQYVKLGPGTSQSATGLVRVAHGQEVIKGKDNAGTSDRVLFSWGTEATNTLQVGQEFHSAWVKGTAGTSLILRADGSDFRLVQMQAGFGTNQRVLGLVSQAALTGAQLPSGVGDRVVYVADRGTAPSVDAVSGHLYYSESGRPAWRFNSVNLRIDGTSGTANTGAGGAPPAQVVGYITITLNGTERKIPYYAT